MRRRDWRAFAAGLASLPAEDPERIAAYRRAERDPELRAALTEAERALELIDQLDPPPPSPSALRLAEGAVLREMRKSAERTTISGRLRMGVALSVVGTWWILLAWRGVPVVEAIDPIALGLLACGGLAAMLSLGAGLLGLVLGLGAAAVTAVLIGLQPPAYDIAVTARGVRCVGVAAFSFVLPLVVALGIALHRQRLARSAGAVGMAAAASAGGLGGMAALQALCPDHGLSHVLLAHAGGVALAALIGAAIGAGALRLKRATRHAQSP